MTPKTNNIRTILVFTSEDIRTFYKCDGERTCAYRFPIDADICKYRTPEGECKSRVAQINSLHLTSRHIESLMPPVPPNEDPQP